MAAERLSLGRSIPVVWRHLAFAVLIFGAWEIYARVLDNEVLFPAVSAVLVALVDLISSGELLPALFDSLQLLAIGFFAAFVVGTLLGIIVGRYRVMDRTLSPYFNAFIALPTVALVPLVLVWFGFGSAGRIIVVVISSFFPILVNTYAGVRDAPGDLIEVAKSFGVRREVEMLRRVVMPSALPFIMAGLRLGIGRGVVGMAIAEVYMRLSGLGTLIVEYGSLYLTDYVIAAILPLPLLGVGLTKVFGLIEKRLEYWRT